MEFTAVLKGECPRCKKGQIFRYPLSRITHFSDMHERCPECGVSFQPEPGFYFGALYVSYAFNVAFFVTIYLLLLYTIDPPVWVYMLSIVLCSIIFIPISFRYSRILFLYWFGGIHQK